MAAVRRPWLVFPLLLVAACGSGPDIRGKDRDALLSSSRIYVELARRASEPGRVQPIRGIEVEFAGVQGNFANDQSGRADYDLLESHVVFRFGGRARHVEFFGLGGLAAVHFDGHTSYGARVDDEHLGATAGFQFGWRATEWLVPYARVSGALFGDRAHALRSEAGVEWRPCSGFGMYAGYGYWEFEQDSESFVEPDVDVTTQGLLVGLEMRF